MAGDSSGDDMQGLGDGGSDEEKEETEGKEQQQDFEEAYLTCIACGITNQDICPIAKRRNKHAKTRVQWGKISSKKIQVTGGGRKRRKVQCGSWCLICFNIFRLRLLKQYKAKAAAAAAAKGPGKSGKAQAPLKLFATDLTRNAELRGRFKGWRTNYVKQRADGRKRVSNIKERVEKKHQTRNRMIGQKKKFYTPSAFLKAFKTDYKTLKLKLKTKKFKGKEIKGIVVNVGEEGVFDIETDDLQMAERAEVLDDGDDVLSEGQLDEVMAGAEQEQDDEAGGPAVSIDAIREKIANLPQEAARDGAVGENKDQEAESDDKDSDSDSNSDSSDSSNSKRGDDEDDDGESKPGPSDDEPDRAEVASTRRARRITRKSAGHQRPPADAIRGRLAPTSRRPLQQHAEAEDARSRISSSRGKARAAEESSAVAASHSESPLPSAAAKSEVGAQSAWCDALISTWASGEHDQMKGRQKNSLVREWLEKLGIARKVNKKFNDRDLESKIDEIQAIADFAKVNVPGANHVQLLTAWDTLRMKTVKSSATLHEIMFMRHAEHMLATDGVHPTLTLFDNSHPRALKHLEETLQKKCAVSLGAVLMKRIFPSKMQSEPTPEVIKGAQSDLGVLIEKLNSVTLPPDVTSQLDHLGAFLIDNPEADALAKALEMCKQAASTMKSSMLGIFAGSKVGKTLIKKQSIVSCTLLKDQVKHEELVKTKERVLQAIKANEHDKQFVWNLLEGYLDAVRGLGESAVAASTADITSMKDCVASWTWRVLAEMMIAFVRSLDLNDVAGVARCSPTAGAEDQGVTETVFRAFLQTELRET